MNPRNVFSSGAVLAVVVTLVVTGLIVDSVAIGTRSLGATDAEVPLLAGSSTCAAMDLEDASQVTATTVAAPLEDATAPDASLRLAADGEVRALADLAVDGGVLATAVADGPGVASVTARWHEAPLLLSRRWTIDSTQRVPGTVEGPCPAGPATDWVVPGVTTAGGTAAVLYLANPTDGAASLEVTFTTPDGPVAPTRLANLAVPAHGQVTVDLNQFVPEEPDLGVVVATRAGRVVAEVLQTAEAAVGGVDGRSLVVAEPTLGETWTIPWVTAGDQESAWVWVTNPGEEATDVRLVLHTEAGPVVPPDSGVTLAPGATQRIDLRGALSEVGTAAVTVRSAPGVPIAASGAVLRVVEGDAVRGGLAVVEAQQAGEGPFAALSAVGATGTQRRLSLVNPGEVDAVLDVSVVGSSAGASRVVATGLRVPAGAWLQLDLQEDLPLEGGFAVVVDVTEGAAAATLVSESLEGPLDLTAAAARRFPSSITVPTPRIVRDRSLMHPVDLAELTGEPDASEEPQDLLEGDEDALEDQLAPLEDPATAPEGP